MTKTERWLKRSRGGVLEQESSTEAVREVAAAPSQ